MTLLDELRRELVDDLALGQLAPHEDVRQRLEAAMKQSELEAAEAAVAELVDDFERGWLILADLYIGGGKYDLAEELCRRCLGANKSCAKAWEFLGYVKEKEMSYKDAASHYESAWRLATEREASLGYKLSFNYLKAKKYVDAIDVCHKVLEHFPDYKGIRKDVLEKARQALARLRHHSNDLLRRWQWCSPHDGALRTGCRQTARKRR